MNSGGLVFTFDNAPGQTKTTVSEVAAGVVTVSGGNTNITVTQDQVGSGATFGNTIVITGGYTGTLTLNNVVLKPEAGNNAIKFDNPAPKGDEGATVVLAGSTKLTGNGTQPAVLMGYSTASTNDTLVVQAGTSILGGNASGILVGAAPNGAAVSNAPGNCVIELAGGNVSGGTVSTAGVTKDNPIGVKNGTAAIAYGSNAAGSLTINVTGNSTVSGSNGAIATAGTAANPGAPAIMVNASGDETADVTISGSANLTLNGGNGTSNNTKGDATDATVGQANGGNAIDLIAGDLVFNTTGVVTLQGGNGGSITDNTVTPMPSFSSGGIGLALWAPDTASAYVTVNSGTFNALGGNGASAPSGGTTLNGIAGGAGIAVAMDAGETDGSGGAGHVNLMGGTINATGGNGGMGSSDSGTQGAGGIGMSGACMPDGAGSFSGNQANAYLSIGVGKGNTPPTITAKGGIGNANADGEDAKAGYSTLGFKGGSAGNGPTLAYQASRRATVYPWVVITNSSNDASAPTAADPGTIIGFAGMAGSAPTGVTTGGNTAYALFTQGGLYQALSAATDGYNPATPYTWTCIKPAPVTSLDAGLVYDIKTSIGANDYGNTAVINDGAPAPYVVAQTVDSMTGSVPNPAFTYTGSLTATFEGVENANLATSFFRMATGSVETAQELDIQPEGDVTYNSTANTFTVNQNATGNLEVNLSSDSMLTSKDAPNFVALYPDLVTSEEPTEIPVIYTVKLVNSAVSGTTPTTPSQNYLYTNGKGDLVSVGTAGTWQPLTPTLTSATPVTSIAVPATMTGKTTANGTFIGWFDESATLPEDWTQVSQSVVTGWDQNAVLTAEWGANTLQGVTPTPQTLPQGTSVTLTATYNVTAGNTKIATYSIDSAGFDPAWAGVFVNAGFGNSTSNGVTVKQSPEGIAPVELTDGKASVTSQAIVTANSTADLGFYRIWPGTWGATAGTKNPAPVPADINNVNGPVSGIYAVVQVVAGTEPPAGEVNVIRMYNPNSGEHLYTTDPNEASTLENSFGWENENVAWVAPQSSAVPIWRLYNPYNGDHLYTTSANEYQTLSSPSGGWRGEGIKLYSAPNDGNSVPVYRLFNPHMTANGGAYAHLWTGDYNEYVTLWQRDGWSNESVAFYAVSVPNPS